MTVYVNGEAWELTDGSTLADITATMQLPPSGVAVAVNGAVVRRADWDTTRLPAGATVEVLTAVQGG